MLGADGEQSAAAPRASALAVSLLTAVVGVAAGCNDQQSTYEATEAGLGTLSDASPSSIDQGSLDSSSPRDQGEPVQPADLGAPSADADVDAHADSDPTDTGPPPGLIDWVEVPGGRYVRGHPDEPRAYPQREVAVRRFSISRTEVTEAQYQACVRVGVCTTSARDTDRCHGIDGYGPFDPRLASADKPAVCITWAEARSFALWVSGRLPTEAEWEYAARRGREDQPYPWGAQAPSCERTIMSQGGFGCGEDGTWPVCSRPADASVDGLCDVVGNVREWLEDFAQPDYETAPVDGGPNQFPSEIMNRSVRSASWRNGTAARFTLYHRSSADPKEGYDFVGFRVAR